MKKIAFIFVVAAMFVSCSDAPKTTQDDTLDKQIDSIYHSLRNVYVSKANSIKPKFVPLSNGEIDSAACIEIAENSKAAILAAGDTTNQLFKIQYNACVHDFLLMKIMSIFPKM